MALVTLRTRDVGPLRCEVCGIERTAGLARGVVLDEGPDVGTVWLLWVLPDGWSVSDESSGATIAVCADDQSDPLIRVMRFRDIEQIAR